MSAAKRVRVPTLGVWGSRDGALLEGQMLASAAYCSDWRYLRLDGVGHFIALDAPDALNGALLGFLADTEDAQPRGGDGGASSSAARRPRL